MYGVTRLDRIRNEEVRGRTGVIDELSGRVDESVLKWFGHMKRMGNERLTTRVWSAEAAETRVLGRPRHRWIDGVKRALRNRSIELAEARVRARDRND